MGTKAEELGVEIYPGFAGSEVLYKNGGVAGEPLLSLCFLICRHLLLQSKTCDHSNVKVTAEARLTSFCLLWWLPLHGQFGVDLHVVQHSGRDIILALEHSELQCHACIKEHT